MKRTLIVSVVSLFVATGSVQAQQSAAPAAPAPTAAAAPAKPAAATAGLTISRMDIAGSIQDRKPVDVAASFPATQDKVYCYLELKDIARDQTITYAWTNGQDMDKITQQIKKSARWRTWGNKSIAGRKGDWKVDVLDENGAVLKSAAFKVE